MKLPRKLKKAIHKDTMRLDVVNGFTVGNISKLPNLTIGDKKRINKWIRSEYWRNKYATFKSGLHAFAESANQAACGICAIANNMNTLTEQIKQWRDSAVGSASPS